MHGTCRYQKVNGGRASSEDEITGLLIAVLFAGQHTSSITTSWTGLRMVGDKGRSYQRALEEQRQIVGKVGESMCVYLFAFVCV